MFNNYYNERKYIVDALAFHYREGYYTGHGILTWKPEIGFHIEAFLQRTGAPIPDKWGIGDFVIIPRTDYRTIRMKLRRNVIAIAPSVPITDQLDLFFERHLDLLVGPVIFLNQTKNSSSASAWRGASLYKFGNRLLLPDTVNREEKINNETVKRGFYRAGLSYEDTDNQKIIGYQDEDKSLILKWHFEKARWTKVQSWNWPNAACQALSILSGERVRLLQKEFFKERQIATEMYRKADVESLGILNLFDSDLLDKKTFINLTEFLVRNIEQARICNNLFHQVLEASRQRNWQARELLLSTALEAALRSIEEVPFAIKKSKNKQWEIRASLENFRKKYLSDEWTSVLEKVLRAHFRLRDRNAHPDWLLDIGGALSDEEMENSLDDMILLSRFYGYMILALSGDKNLKPIFPVPHRNWQPPIIVEKIK